MATLVVLVDERLILRSVRDGKESSDFMITAIHSHESPSSLPFDFLQEQPTDFLIRIAHEAIDNGADAFVGSGVHILRGIEMYQGKPIFYGLMSFVYQAYGTPVSYGRFRDVGVDPFSTNYTDTELNWIGWPPLNIATHDNPLNMESMESVVGEAKYQDGKLVEVILHPIDFGYGAQLSQRGIPHISSPEVAQRIPTRLQRLSKPLGTNVAIEGQVGVIRVGQDGKSL